VARGDRRAQASPTGNAAEGLAGGVGARPWGFGVWPEGDSLGDVQEPHHGPGRAIERPGGPDTEDGAVVRQAPHGAMRRRARALAPDGPIPIRTALV
jgi:hypothetical protein